MTPLRQRMIEDLKLRGYNESTQTLYVTAVRQLCEHFGKSPGKITVCMCQFQLQRAIDYQ